MQIKLLSAGRTNLVGRFVGRFVRRLDSESTLTSSLEIAPGRDRRRPGRRSSGISRRNLDGRSSISTVSAQTQGETPQFGDQLPHQVDGGLVGQATLGIELRFCVCDVYMRRVDWNHVERHADVAQMELATRTAERTN